MAKPIYGFIGLGLIGGSIARGLKRADPDVTIMAYMRTRAKLEQAKKDGTIDLILDGIDGALSLCDVIFLCTPVEYNASYLQKLQPVLKEGALITDVGSTKTGIHETVSQLNMEAIFVGGHPMAGSEKTGYENSTDHLLENAYYVITPTKKTTQEQIERMKGIAAAIGAIPMVLDYREHDYAVAAISHLPHLIASSLVNLVRDNDSPEGIMKQMAAGGFKDITRIASSSPVMWEQICMTNTDNIKLLLKKYIDALNTIYDELESKDSGSIYRLFERDLCLLSASCVMQNIQFEVTIEAEKDSSLFVVPARTYKALQEQSAAVANYTSQLMAGRFSEVMWLLEQIMWKSFDRRLAEFLLNETLLEGSSSLKITHEAIGNHLGTAREVVTRMLRYFQSEQMVKLSRGVVEVTDSARLRKLCGE